MNQLLIRLSVIVAVAAGVLALDAATRAADDPDPTRIKTADGLHLWGKWYVGGKNQNSDTVILVHGYGSDSSKGPWESLAKELQKEGYSVLLFDLRGHGKSTDFKVFDDKDAFTNPKLFPFNKLTGATRQSKDLRREKFSAAYYPYLVNDLVAARRFVDSKHDIPECNTNRVFVITEQSSCPLVMLWAAIEYLRQGVGPAFPGSLPNKYVAGKDIAGLVFLSWTAPRPDIVSGVNAAMSVLTQISNDKVMGAEAELVKDQLRNKVAMAWIYGKEDRAAAGEAARWFNKFGIPPGKKDDAELMKYMVEVAGAEKLSGSKLLDIMEENNGNKVSVVQGQVLAFLKKTKQKGINGSGYQQKRFATNIEFMPVPIENGRWTIVR